MGMSVSLWLLMCGVSRDSEEFCSVGFTAGN